MSRGKPCHVEITIRDQSQLQRLIKKFNRKCKKSGLFEEVRERRYFKKKSATLKEKRENRKRTHQKLTQKHKDKFKNEYK
jgi:ribosomal protein S21